MKNIIVLLILILLSFTGMGCEAKGTHLTIKFDQIHGLTADDSVISETNRIGKVEKVTYTRDGNYLVRLMIEKAFANSATEHTRFFIVSNPQSSGRKAVEMTRAEKGGTPLKNNAVVEGSTKSSVIVERLEKDLERGMADLAKQFNSLAEELKKVSDSEAFKKLEDELTNLYVEMKRSGKEVREMIQKEILPRLEQELENLKKRLHKKGREDELKPLEIKMDKIRKI
jgi:ABC-type transporter Mla subunit MlaD